ncbi:RDD family protein [Mesorhizobium sp. NPDC059054]|uniref:RDD family protein n=1 Tax=Mesorhizobium sp. NPDC059054 TaxID=3346711 RepID=UPI00367503AC
MTTGETQQLEKVWLGPRFVGLFVDWLIFFVLSGVTWFWTVSSVFSSNVRIPPQQGVFPAEMFTTMTRIFLIEILLLFAYLVVMETWRGATVGKMLAGIRTIDLSAPDHRPPPFVKALPREFVKAAGFLPSLVTSMVFSTLMANVTNAEQLESMMSTDGWFFPLQFIAQFLPLIWLAWIAVSLVNNRDPIYDRLSGTAVVRA